MDLVSRIDMARRRGLVDEDGEPVPLELLPGLGELELRRFAASLPCPLPPHVEELLRVCGGFRGPLEVDFTGRTCDVEVRDAFPHGLPVAHNGCGDFWVVDLGPGSTRFGPIWAACHDPPVMVYESEDLAAFLDDLLRSFEQPDGGPLSERAWARRMLHVWTTNPGVLERAACERAADPVLREFAARLPEGAQVIDLRRAARGDGFSWGRYGPQTVLHRHGELAVFAYEPVKGLLQRARDYLLGS